MKKSREQKRKEAIEARRKAAKKRQQKNKPAPKLTAPPSLSFHFPQSLRRPFALTWKVYLAVIGILSAIVTVATFYPRLSVTALESLNPASPFTAPFVVSNDGYFDLKDITCHCVVRRVVVAGMRDVDVSDNRVETTDAAIPVLRPNEKTTINCPSMLALETPLTRADMDIVLSYKLSVTPLRLSKPFRFTTEMASDKQLRWFPRSGSE